MGKIKLLTVLVIAYLIIFPSALPAELSTAQFDIIRIAYMNGYANAVHSDLETIKSLKEDPAKLKKYAQVAVKDYMEKVNALNKEGMVAGNKKSISSSSFLPL